MKAYETHNAQRSMLSETNDCTVLSIAEAAGVDYNTAHEAMRRAGREHGFGARIGQVFNALIELGIDYKNCSDFKSRNTTQLRHELNNGNYIVFMPKHAAPLIDGQYSDWVNGAKKGRKVQNVIQVTPVEVQPQLEPAPEPEPEDHVKWARREWSQCENPCNRVWRIANELLEEYGEAKRSVVIIKALAQGVAKGTAAKQYNDWRKANNL